MVDEIKTEVTTITESKSLHSLMLQWYSEVNWLKFTLLSIASIFISLGAFAKEGSLRVIMFGVLAAWGNFVWGFFTTGTNKK